MKKLKIFLYLAISIIVVTGIFAIFTKVNKKDLNYSYRQFIIIINNTELDKNKIEEIAKKVLENKIVKVKEVERFGNALEIISTEITNEEKENIINDINEQCGLELSNSKIDVLSVNETNIKDIVYPYILPCSITFILVIVYFMIIYHKLGCKMVLLKSFCFPVIIELIYYSVIVVGRISINNIIIAISLALYILSIVCLGEYFQNKKLDKKEND